MEKVNVKGNRTTIAVTEDFIELFDSLKVKGYNFSTISAMAIRDAINTDMAVPESKQGKGFISSDILVGVLIPTDVEARLNELTKPTGAKAAYIREAIKLWVANNLKD